jgi:hypothetical protein
MYCPSCGLEQTQELRYCPRCGANLAPASQESRPPNLIGPIWAVSLAITLITLAGLGFVFAFAMVLITRGIPLNGSMFLLISFFMFIVFAIAGLLVRQLSRLLGLYHKPAAQADKNYRPQTNELAGSAAPPRLEAMPEPPLSVTENTTRAFEPAQKGSQTKQNVPRPGQV